MEMAGATGAEIDAFEAQWVKNTKLMTCDEAVVKQLQAYEVSEEDIYNYQATTINNRDMSITKRKQLASQFTDRPIYFNIDIPRTREGFYHYQAGMKAATKRAIEYAPFADLLWVETGDPSVANAAQFSGEIRENYPGKGLVYNLSPSFNWMGHGFSPETLKSFIWDIAKHGFVLQLISLAGLHSGAVITNELSKGFKEDGMLAYVNLVQKREKELGVDVLTHQKWSGAQYIDGILGSIQSGSSSTKGMGEGNTEGQF
jgi:isocitrate lyase